jgi:signal transduction histidine kinase
MLTVARPSAVAPTAASRVPQRAEAAIAPYSPRRTSAHPRADAGGPELAYGCRVETRPPWAVEGPPWAWRGHRPDERRRRLFTPLLVAAIQATGCLLASGRQPDATHLDGLGYALLVAGPAALVWRRSQPVLTFAVVQVATVAYLVLGYPAGPFFLAALVALLRTVRLGHRVAAWVITGTGYTAYVLGTQGAFVVGGRATVPASLGQYVVVAAWTAVALAIAEVTRIRTERFAEMARTRAESARARQEQARRQASDERLRIAQELHDVLGHHLSLINVRAGVALHLLDTRPEQAREALGAIKQASAEALREVRTVLSTLNPDDTMPPRSPAPVLADVDRLVKDTTDAGLAVHIERTGTVRPLPAGVERAAYRIIQEALTNVRRHAGPVASVTVVLGYAPDELLVRVEDTGSGPGPSTSEGNGIPGMRERAAALGGTLVAEPSSSGGFRVEAHLPLPTLITEHS